MATTHYKTKIVLYKGVPFGIDYNHTLEPGTIEVKYNFFELYPHDEFNDLQTIHMNSVTDTGTMRLVVYTKDAYEYNYAYIEDNKHGLKFFAFITGCRYINDAQSNPSTSDSLYKCVYEFMFAKDLLMTYLEGDNNWMATPIIRHTATARYNSGFYGEDLSFPLVEYDITSTNRKLGYEAPETDTYTVLWCSFNWPDPESAPDSTLNGLLNCVLGLVYRSTDSVKQDLVTLAEQQGFQLLGVTAMPNFMFNWDAAPTPTTIRGKMLTDLFVNDKHSFNINSKNYFKNLVETKANYTVANKKCFYHPFAKFSLESNAGSVIDLAPEYLNTSTSADISFIVTCSAGRPCNYTVVPFYYGAIDGKNSPNMKCTTSAFPEGCATLDSYAMYLANRYKFPDSNLGIAAQHLVEAVPGIVGSAANLLVSSGGALQGVEETDWQLDSKGKSIEVGTGVYNYAGNRTAAASGLGAAASSLAQAKLTADAMRRSPDTVCGAVASPETDFIRNNIDVKVIFLSLHPETLIGLDNYFERFGYAQGGEIRTPDLAGRDRYVYCQTGGNGFISKKCNAAEITKINNIFMRGVTCWRRSLVLPAAGLSYGANGDDTIADAM